MLVNIIGIVLVLVVFIGLDLLLNALNDNRRKVDPSFDKYLSKQNIRTDFAND